LTFSDSIKMKTENQVYSSTYHDMLIRLFNLWF